MRISDWSSDVCSSDLRPRRRRSAARAIRWKRRWRPVSRKSSATPQARMSWNGTRLQRKAAVPSGRAGDRKSVVEGKSVSVRVDLGGRRIIKQQKLDKHANYKYHNRSTRNFTKP